MRRPSIAYALFTGLVTIGLTACCKPQEAPPPEIPQSPELAKTPEETQAQPAASPMGELPPGHPPIGGERQAQQQAAQDSGLPPGHPPIGGQQPGQMPATNDMGLPAGHPPINPTGTTSEGAKAEAETDFDGLRLTPPEGWQPFNPASNRGFTPIAAFVLPHVEGDTEDATARLTHFPAMKNTPVEANLDRWYGQIAQPDGKPTKDVAKVEEFEANGVKVTLADMTGLIPGQGDATWRMMAAVIEHPKGPHFLKVVGPEKTMDKWADSVVQYLKSAQIIE